MLLQARTPSPCRATGLPPRGLLDQGEHKSPPKWQREGTGFGRWLPPVTRARPPGENQTEPASAAELLFIR